MSQQQINYKAANITKLRTALEQNPNMTFGEVVFSALHRENINGKHFFYASDVEIHNALERFCKFGIEQEEPLQENEFNFWVAQKSIIKD